MAEEPDFEVAADVKPGGRFSAGSAIWLTLLIVALATLSAPALSYRPFDSTDADVVGAGELELELGPVGYLKEAQEKSLVAPAVVANFGLAGDREIVLQGKLQTLLDNPSDAQRTSLVDTGLFLKQVHRRGSLQDGTGPSVATECGALLPTIHGEAGVGASCAGIVSNRWPSATLHLNAQLALTRAHHPDLFLGGILEGPYDWQVRPALEVFAERESGEASTVSALIGLIWRARENLSFDFGVRVARSDHQDIREVRAGLTWSFALRK